MVVAAIVREYACDSTIHPRGLSDRTRPDFWCCEGFRMPAAWGTAPLVRRPASESLQRRKPRWGDV